MRGYDCVSSLCLGGLESCSECKSQLHRDSCFCPCEISGFSLRALARLLIPLVGSKDDAETRPLGHMGTVPGPRRAPFRPVVLPACFLWFYLCQLRLGWGIETVSQRRTPWLLTYQVLPSSAPFLIGVSTSPNDGNFQNKAEHLERLFACQFPECFSSFPPRHSDAFVSLLLGNKWRGRARSGSAQCPGIFFS